MAISHAKNTGSAVAWRSLSRLRLPGVTLAWFGEDPPFSLVLNGSGFMGNWGRFGARLAGEIWRISGISWVYFFGCGGKTGGLNWIEPLKI